MQEQITIEWVRGMGYNVNSAAKIIKRSRQHLSEVLKGNRESAIIKELLIEKLSKRPYVAREVHSPYRKSCRSLSHK